MIPSDRIQISISLFRFTRFLPCIHRLCTHKLSKTEYAVDGVPDAILRVIRVLKAVIHLSHRGNDQIEFLCIDILRIAAVGDEPCFQPHSAFVIGQFQHFFNQRILFYHLPMHGTAEHRPRIAIPALRILGRALIRIPALRVPDHTLNVFNHGGICAYVLIAMAAQRQTGSLTAVFAQFNRDRLFGAIARPCLPFGNIKQCIQTIRPHMAERIFIEAHTLRGNCNDWVFLTSRELSLLQELESLCGSDVKTGQPLITVSQLQRLNKESGEALVLCGRMYPYLTHLPDIDGYPFADVPPVPLPNLPELRCEPFSFEEYVDRWTVSGFSLPNRRNESEDIFRFGPDDDDQEDDDLYERLDQKFQALYGKKSD